MTKKRIFLFLSLVLPVFVFLFLKFFGKNQFDLPVLHVNATTWPSDCSHPTQFPFKINSSTVEGISSGKPAIIIRGTQDQEAEQRIPVEIDTTQVSILRLPSSFNVCLIGATPEVMAVLVDGQGNIRSVFNKLNRDETDRLILETKILIKDY